MTCHKTTSTLLASLVHISSKCNKPFQMATSMNKKKGKEKRSNILLAAKEALRSLLSFAISLVYSNGWCRFDRVLHDERYKETETHPVNTETFSFFHDCFSLSSHFVDPFLIASNLCTLRSKNAKHGQASKNDN